MNTEDVDAWVNATDEMCRTHFSPKTANVSIHFIMGKWCVRIDSPKVYVEDRHFETALLATDRELDRHIKEVKNLALTLGLEAAE